MIHRKAHETNRLSWNEATLAHNSHKKDQGGFLRDGGSTLFPEELELLGVIQGHALLHLQCNAGQDTLSLVHHGAQVTGVDISDVAIEAAKRFSKESGLSAVFERSDVYDWLETASPGHYDEVFCSYGWMGWLSDLQLWAEGVAKVLRPGGRFVAVEFHPFIWVFDDNLELKYPYFSTDGPLQWDDGVSDYVARANGALSPMGQQKGVEDFVNPKACVEFCWAVSDLVQALLGAGLVIEELREYPFSNGCSFFPNMKLTEGRRFVMPDGLPALPLMLGIVARKPG